MHIKKIVIEGFKSYGGRTVIENFHPGHNVIVGSNGSGKSNFFAAIEFVLSDDYNRLEKAQRQALLYEGSGPRSLIASVEIIFDNSDKRMSVDKNEVSLKRMIGTKKDQYILNKKVVTRSEVVSLMEVAGFSRSNPYYIVRQGKVNQVATTSESRLLLLQEIAGVKVYEERRNESFTILNDARLRIKNIDDLLETINEKLESLKNETEELKEYQQWDKKTRTIEYIIYEIELNSSKSKLNDLKKQHDSLQSKQTDLQSCIKQEYLDKIESINNELENAQRQAKTTEENKDGLSEELEKLYKERELRHFRINELQHEIEVDIVNKESINTALEELNGRIEKIQEDLEINKPEYKEAVDKVQETIRTLESLEKKRQILYAKKGRGAQFQNKEERNAWINKELIMINKQIEKKLEHIENLEKDINQNEVQGSELKESQRRIMREMESQWSSIGDFKKGCFDTNKKKEQKLAERKDLYRQQKTLQIELEYAEEDLKKVNQSLMSMFGKEILNGINSVNKVLETFKQHDHNMFNELHQYHGLVIQCFDCEENVYKAVEVIAGNRLFYHIVQTTRFGSEILKEMNRQNLPGVVTFIPLDRIKTRDCDYPEIPDTFPLKSKLKYEKDKYEIPIRYIFGKIILTRDLQTSTEIASEGKFDCITVHGDQVSSKGWLKGGHFAPSKSAMQLQTTKQNLMKDINSKREKLSKLNDAIKKVDDEITENMSTYQKFENKFNKARETYDKLTNDLNGIKEELQIVENNDLLHEKNKLELKSDLNNLEVLKKNLTAELEQDLSDQLTADDQYQINQLNDHITKLKKELKDLFKKRESLETEKMKLENLLSKNLNCKKDELNRRLREISLDNKPLELQNLEEQLRNILNKIDKYESELSQNEEDYQKTSKQKQGKLEEMEKLYGLLKPQQETFENQSKELEKLFCNIKILSESIEITKRKMIDLGCIPSSELRAKYSRMGKKSLYKELDNCRKNLKNYEHINKRALDQYEIFKDSKENLFKRKEELDRANEKIEELFDFLQRKKYEAVHFTFKQVAKYFTEIFSKIVPGGKAQLIMEQGVARNGSDSSSATTLDLDNIVGIGIRVSFSGEMTAMTDYNQLSGGQKSLLALTLIFAIQKCDPAPFYLFDEIDQALDTAHRRAVAQMIHELSSEAQFITSTFRPELLENANQFYGVKFQNNLSSIYNVNKKDALEFVEEDAAE